MSMDWKSHIEGLLSAGATVDQLAVGMGVTPNAVREILAGRTRSPRAEAAFKLAAMKPEHYGSHRAVIGAEVDSRMSKRALRAKFGFKTDAPLAKLLRLPVEQVEAWPEEQGVPALPQVMRLLGVQETPPAAEAAPSDPDADRIINVEAA
jgi:transcriptional regulator with XRE-family HTH domain